MELNDKIYQNIVSQMIVAIKAKKLDGELKVIEIEKERLNGAIGVLSELYLDETGVDLQKAINTDPVWKDVIEKAQAEANEMAQNEVAQEFGNKNVQNGTLQNAETVSNEVIEQEQQLETPKLRRVNDNQNRKLPNIVIDDEPPGPESQD